MLDKIQLTVGPDLEATDQLIAGKLHSDIPFISELADHIVKGGGKRIRPLIVLLSSRSCSYDGKAHIQLAATLELMHTATLLHDDVVDSSTLRRGRHTVNAIWGNQASVLVGDFVYSRIFQMMAELKNMTIIQILADASNFIAEGEVLQLIHCHHFETTEATYFQIIQRKTAALFEVAAQVGPVLANRPSKEIDALKKYGFHLGLAFQLIDDLLDYKGDSQQIGKNIGDDLADGKPTLPLIRALQQSDEAQAHFLKESIKAKKPDCLEKIQAALESTGAVEYTAQLAKEHATQAKLALQSIPASSWQKAMCDLADFAVERQH